RSWAANDDSNICRSVPGVDPEAIVDVRLRHLRGSRPGTALVPPNERCQKQSSGGLYPQRGAGFQRLFKVRSAAVCPPPFGKLAHARSKGRRRLERRRAGGRRGSFDLGRLLWKSAVAEAANRLLG